jgi:hypothetical protein
LGEWRYSYTHSLTLALDGGEWSASRPGRFTPRERAPGTHWIGGWVGPRAVVDAMVKRKIPSPRRESNPRTPIVQPVASALYRLSYHGSSHPIYLISILILSYLRLGLRISLFPLGFATRTFCTFVVFPCALHAPPISSSLTSSF